MTGLGIFKAYHYLYTGLNDQIKQCTIKYDAGIALLAAPAGGVSGDFGTVMAKTISNSASPDEDLTGTRLLPRKQLKLQKECRSSCGN